MPLAYFILCLCGLVAADTTSSVSLSCSDGLIKCVGPLPPTMDATQRCLILSASKPCITGLKATCRGQGADDVTEVASYIEDCSRHGPGPMTDGCTIIDYKFCMLKNKKNGDCKAFNCIQQVKRRCKKKGYGDDYYGGDERVGSLYELLMAKCSCGDLRPSIGVVLVMGATFVMTTLRLHW